MSVDLLSLQQMQYISLQGKHKHLDISCKESTPLEVSNIYITSRPRQEPFTKGVQMSSWCYSNYGYRYIDCFEIYHNNMIFFVYNNIASYFPDQPASEDPNYSWIMANKFCQQIGSELLYFTKREELDDFITMLLEIRHIITFLEAVFIGLRYNELKVNLLKLYEPY